MKVSNGKLRTILLCCLMIPMILDSKTAVSACAGALELCFKTIIPGVFPFLFLGSAIAAELHGFNMPLLERTLRIPHGTAGYFLMGLLCGYPVGAKLLQDAADRGRINKDDVRRMITFCNNASPAFIIGVLSSVFSSPIAAFVMWLIQISASFILAVLLTPKIVANPRINTSIPKSKQNIMLDTCRSIASICGWVAIFAIGLAYLQTPLLSRFAPVSKAFLCGLLELTNGLCALTAIHSTATAYTVSAVILSFGGLCVLLQTKSVAPDMDMGAYILARMFHSVISATLAALAACFLFQKNDVQTVLLLTCAAVVCCMILLFNKKW